MKYNLYLFLLLFILPALTVSAQENLPYTRYGVGELMTTSSAEQRAWGGLDAAFQDDAAFDINNPASLAWLKLTVLQVGLYGRVTDISSVAAGRQGFGYTSPNYLCLGVPIRKNWGISFGLLPYSTVSYDIYQQNGASTGMPSSINEFAGSGTLYQVYLASGWAIKNFAFGVSGSYIFGSLYNDSQQIFSDSLNGFDSNYQIQRKVSSFKWNAGLQYDLLITTTNKKTGEKKKDNHLIFGVSGHTAVNFSAEENYIYNRFYYNSSGVETPYDTLAAANYLKGKIVVPAELNAGVVWRHKERWKLGFNYYYNAYKAYKSFGSADSTCNSFKASIGAQYLPVYDVTGEEDYIRRIKYRLGAYYGNYYLSFDNKPLLNYGITFGAGLPLRRLFSDLDIAFDLGTLGTTENNLVRETYVRGTLGIKFSDKWFLKRKYD